MPSAKRKPATRNSKRRRNILPLVAASGAAGAAGLTSSLPGYQTTLANCSTCHSAHYAEYQPPNSGKGYWQATVVKMKNVFKAPINEEDVPAIVEYLTETYGANRK